MSPEEELHSLLAMIWEEILEVKPIGAQGHFFELGGDSLRALDLVIAIEKIFGKRLSLATLLQTPTLGQLAALLSEGEWLSPRSALVAFQGILASHDNLFEEPYVRALAEQLKEYLCR
ncbi:MAG: hypothetical protein IRY99_16680 [Isosphaeraceae bacterium]|nr:hypothetical protein [Isosphaeraceae bacterium]